MHRAIRVLPVVVCLTAACDIVKSAPPSAPTPLVETTTPTGAPSEHSYPSSGPEVIAYVAARYPDKLAAGVNGDERVANMRFLRDRIIEAGRCGGMDLGWNLKRGGPDISNDFIVERVNGEDHGIDIAFDYDNTSQILRLQWIGGEGPFYKTYPETPCE